MTRGINNNNPGNIIISNINWQGEKINNTDSKFVQFTDMEHGCRALLLNLRSSIKNHGRNTIPAIIQAYAPPSENETGAYIANVLQMTGLNGDTVIDAADSVNICAIAAAICNQENGHQEALTAGLTKDYFTTIWVKYINI